MRSVNDLRHNRNNVSNCSNDDRSSVVGWYIYFREVKMKATNTLITHEYLKRKTTSKYARQKWIEFCEHLLNDGFELSLYEARQTVSKYITIRHSGKLFKVRFSNHLPIRHKELAGDCDLFVGKSHTGTINTKTAILEVYKWADPVWKNANKGAHKL